MCTYKRYCLPDKIFLQVVKSKKPANKTFLHVDKSILHVVHSAFAIVDTQNPYNKSALQYGIRALPAEQNTFAILQLFLRWEQNTFAILHLFNVLQTKSFFKHGLPICMAKYARCFAENKRCGVIKIKKPAPFLKKFHFFLSFSSASMPCFKAEKAGNVKNVSNPCNT